MASVSVERRAIIPRKKTFGRQRFESTREDKMIEALSPHLNLMVRAVRQAGIRMIRDFGEVAQLQVSQKGPGDFVSNADLMAEKTLISFLKEARPDYGFISEESHRIAPAHDSPFTWIIDPIDGTINFIHGIPFFSISLALAYKDDVIAGVVYNPIENHLYYAEKSKGAFVMTPAGTVRLRVSGRKQLYNSLIGSNAYRSEKNAPILKKLVQDAASVRFNGSTTLSLAMVAAGQLDVYVATQFKTWDIAAGLLLVSEAGGYVADFDGHKKLNDIIASQYLVATSVALKEVVLKKLKGD